MTGSSSSEAKLLKVHSPKPRGLTFYFHYNKPASQRAGKQQISVHYQGVCHIVDNLECLVPTRGKLRKTQPRFVMSGKAQDLQIVNGIAIIS